MKNLATLIVVLLLLGSAELSAQKCFITCSIPASHGRICPGSTVGDPVIRELGTEGLKDLGYTLQPNGCWTLANNRVVINGTDSRLRKLFKKLLKLFGAARVQKSGF